MKKKIEIAYDSEIPLFIYPEKMIIQKDRHPSVHCSTVYKSQGMEMYLNVHPQMNG